MRSTFFGTALKALAVSAVIVTSHTAAALNHEDIAGKWCSDFGSYTFSRERLLVLFNDGTPRRNYRIHEYEYEDDTIRVNWDKDGEKVHTMFGNFSANGRRMAQIANRNDKVPRREFRRC